jgi:hypothetical protein
MLYMLYDCKTKKKQYCDVMLMPTKLNEPDEIFLRLHSDCISMHFQLVF